jgi:hypothetical protein
MYLIVPGVGGAGWADALWCRWIHFVFRDFPDWCVDGGVSEKWMFHFKSLGNMPSWLFGSILTT